MVEVLAAGDMAVESGEDSQVGCAGGGSRKQLCCIVGFRRSYDSKVDVGAFR